MWFLYDVVVFILISVFLQMFAHLQNTDCYHDPILNRSERLDFPVVLAMSFVALTVILISCLRFEHFPSSELYAH